MTKLAIFALPVLALAGPALAGPDCSGGTGPVKPMWELAQSFEQQGGTIKVMKVSDSCYEIYGKIAETDVEIYYDPRTFAELEREEG